MLGSEHTAAYCPPVWSAMPFDWLVSLSFVIPLLYLTTSYASHRHHHLEKPWVILSTEAFTCRTDNSFQAFTNTPDMTSFQVFTHVQRKTPIYFQLLGADFWTIHNIVSRLLGMLSQTQQAEFIKLLVSPDYSWTLNYLWLINHAWRVWPMMRGRMTDIAGLSFIIIPD